MLCPTLSGTKYSKRSDFVARVTIWVATATTTILAAGLVEGIPSSLSWDTQQSNLNAWGVMWDILYNYLYTCCKRNQ
jgi:hypothetical protein